MTDVISSPFLLNVAEFGPGSDVLVSIEGLADSDPIMVESLADYVTSLYTERNFPTQVEIAYGGFLITGRGKTRKGWKTIDLVKSLETSARLVRLPIATPEVRVVSPTIPQSTAEFLALHPIPSVPTIGEATLQALSEIPGDIGSTGGELVGSFGKGVGSSLGVPGWILVTFLSVFVITLIYLLAKTGALAAIVGVLAGR